MNKNKLKQLFDHVEGMERDCWNALKYYKHIEDNLAYLHYELDKLLTTEEFNEINKNVSLRTPDAYRKPRNGNDDFANCEQKGSDVGGCQGASEVADHGSTTRKSCDAKYPDWGKQAESGHYDPTVPGIGRSDNKTRY